MHVELLNRASDGALCQKRSLVQCVWANREGSAAPI